MLFRYLLSSHIKFSSMILFLGVVVYFLAEIFEKIDGFSDANVDNVTVVIYFLMRMPGMITTILPAVFFIATIIVLCNMAKTKELLALQSGGISLYKILKIVLVFAFSASIFQFVLSQFVAIDATVKASALRTQAIRNYDVSTRPIHNIWFKHNQWVIHLESLKRDGTGSGITAFNLDDNGQTILEIIQAENVQVNQGEWELVNVITNKPHNFSIQKTNSTILPFKRLHQSFFAIDSKTNLQDLPADQLYIAIKELKGAGANVESLETAFQAKFAYAGSIISLVFLAFAIFTISPNVYIGVSIGTFMSFMAYIFIMIADTLGQDGRLTPFMAAWLPHIVIILLSLTRILAARK